MPVRKYLLAAAGAAAIATAVVATPAAARDHSGYVGIDAGIMWSDNKAHIDATDSYYCDYFDYYFSSCSVGVGNRNKLGYDIDARGGYDFGMFRLEGELAYKHAKQKSETFGSSTG